MHKKSYLANAVPLSISRLEEVVNKVAAAGPETNKSYHLAYQAFLRYFAKLDCITREELIIGAHFTYGWMPRMLTLHGDGAQMDHAAGLLNAAKYGQVLHDEDLECLAKTINNSIVGASKLLHFVSPDHYAMWDSRVCAFLYGANIYESRVYEIRRYTAYLEMCHSMVEEPAFPALQTRIGAMMEIDEVPPLRAVEWVMYRSADL